LSSFVYCAQLKLLAFLLSYVTKGTKKTFAAALLKAVSTSEIRKQKNAFQIVSFLFLIAFRPFQLITFKAECRLTKKVYCASAGMAFVSQAGYLSDAVDVKKQMCLSFFRGEFYLF